MWQSEVYVIVLTLVTLDDAIEIGLFLFFVMPPKVTKASKEVRKAMDRSLMRQTDVYAFVLALVTLGGATEMGSFLFFVALPKVTKASKEDWKAIDSSHVIERCLCYCTCCGHLGWHNRDRIIPIFFFPPKVTKASKEGHRQLPHTTDRCLCYCTCLGHLGRHNRDRIISSFLLRHPRWPKQVRKLQKYITIII